MTAADLPTTHGIPNNGGEGFRFLGYPAYDSVINWDFTHTDKIADITPGLFTAWRIDEANPLRWICDVRQGVKFHDGIGLQCRRGDVQLRPHLRRQVAAIRRAGRADRARDRVDDRQVRESR